MMSAAGTSAGRAAAPAPVFSSYEEVKHKSSHTGHSHKPSSPSPFPQPVVAPNPKLQLQNRVGHTDLYASRRPKHAIQGFSDGVSNIVAGVSVGVTGVVAGTAAGAHQSGVFGGVVGFFGGLGGMVVSIVYGTYAGVRQMARGVWHTPAAVYYSAKGDVLWDSAEQKWVTVCLTKDLQHVPIGDDDIEAAARRAYHEAQEKEKAAAEAKKAKKEKHLKEVKEKNGTHGGAGTAAPPAAEPTSTAPHAPASSGVDYYTYLGVSRTATQAEIKQAFARKALDMHPDKNPNDPNATHKFQELLQVYDILSHDITRATYDRYGTVDPAAVDAVTPSNPLADAVAASFLEPLVGKLTFFRFFQKDALFDGDMLAELDRRRRLRLAQRLCEYVDDTERGFDKARTVLHEAVSTPLGVQVVTFAAEEYHVAARQHLHSSRLVRDLDSFFASRKAESKLIFKLSTTATSTAVKAATKTLEDEDVLEMLCVAMEGEIRPTVLRACRLVLYDTSVSDKDRQTRAERLEQLSTLAVEEVRKETEAREKVAKAKAEAEAKEEAEATAQENARAKPSSPGAAAPSKQPQAFSPKEGKAA